MGFGFKGSGSSGSSYNLGLVDRYGNAFATKPVNDNIVWDLRTLTPYDMADIFLNELSSPSITVQNAINYYVENMDLADLWDDLYTCHPLVNGNANDHALNLKYPFRKPSANYGLFFGSPTQNANGLTTNGTNSSMVIPIVPNIFANDGSRFALSVYSRTSGAANSNLCTDIGGVTDGNQAEISRIMIRTSVNYQDACMGGGGNIYKNDAYTGSAAGLFTTYLGGATDGLARNGVNLTGGTNFKSPIQQPRFSAISIGAQYFNSLLTSGWFTARNYSYAASMKAWSISRELDHYNIVQQMQTILGRQV